MEASKKKRVLVIDDRPTSTRMVRLALEKFDSILVQEENVSMRAVNTAREFRPDLILLDVEMPGMDGGSVWRALRAEAAFKTTPVIFFTTLVNDEKAASPDAAGACDKNTRILAKPLTLSKLAGALADLLGGMVRGTMPAPDVPAPTLAA